MKKCNICQEEKKEITTLRLRIGKRMGSRIGNNYIEPIDLDICFHCKKT